MISDLIETGTCIVYFGEDWIAIRIKCSVEFARVVNFHCLSTSVSIYKCYFCTTPSLIHTQLAHSFVVSISRRSSFINTLDDECMASTGFLPYSSSPKFHICSCQLVNFHLNINTTTCYRSKVQYKM
jgi:hypothetical protein